MTELTPYFLDTPPGFPDVLIGARQLRSAFAGLQPGVLEPGDLKVTPGPGLSVDVSAGGAVVGGTINPPRQGRYRIDLDLPMNSESFETGGLGATDPNLDRIAQIVARVYDHQEDNSGETKWRLQVLAGVPTGGATLDNRAGATPTLPPNSIRIADVRIRPNAGAIIADDIRDRRQWARGAHWFAVGHNASDGTGVNTDYGVTGVIAGFRLELSGAPLAVTYTGRGRNDVAGLEAFTTVLIDGATPIGDVRLPDSWDNFTLHTVIGNASPGSHTFAIGINAPAGGTVRIKNTSGTVPRLEVRELLAPLAVNG